MSMSGGTSNCITYVVGVWELRKARFYGKKTQCSIVPVSDLIWGLRDVGDGGRFRCLQGISCIHTVGSAQCSRCVVYGLSALAAIHNAYCIIVHNLVSQFAIVF